MTKNEILEAVYHGVGGSSRAQTAEQVSFVFEAIKDALAKGETVKITSFGVFYVRKKKKRMGRNPKTGQEATISARKVVSFRASPVLKKHIDTK